MATTTKTKKKLPQRTPARWVESHVPGADEDPLEVLRWALSSAGFKPDIDEPYDEVDENVTPEVLGPEPDEATKAKLNAKYSESEAMALHERLLSKSLSYFLSEMLIGPPEFDGRVLVPQHHEQWCELLEDHRRVCILAPREHGKSFVCSVAYALWRAYTEPGCQIWIFSKTQDQASRILQDIKDQLEGSPALASMIPIGVRGWSAKRVILANGSRIFARGFGVRVRGAHPKYIVCDDVLNDEAAWSKTQRARQAEYFFSAITNLVSAAGQIVVVGTPFHTLDLYGEIQRRGAYEFRRYSALMGEGTGHLTALWPEKHSVEILLFKKWEMGEILFARELQCVAVSDDISLFPMGLLHSARAETFHLGLPRQFWIDRGCTLYGGVDVATGATAGSDYFVILILAVDQMGHRWFVEMYRAHKLSFAQMRAALNKMASAYLPETLFVESNAAQDLLRQAATAELPCRVVAFHTNADKHRLESGLPSIRVLYEQGRFHTPIGDKRSKDATIVLEEELHGFTVQDGKVISVTEHDDSGMALFLAEQACRYGAGFSFEDASAKVTKAIADATQKGLPVPAPPKMPAWTAPKMPLPPALPDSIKDAKDIDPELMLNTDPSTGLPMGKSGPSFGSDPTQAMWGLGLGGSLSGWWGST